MSHSFDLKKLSALAYLKLSEQDEKKLLPKIERVISYVGKIQNLDLTGEELQDDSLQRQNFREDQAKPQYMQIKELSSFTEENYFVVPRVIQDFD